MRLADFIISNIEPILMEWEAFARSMTSGGTMDALALRDHAGDILLATVRDMRLPQSRTERAAKSRSRPIDNAGEATLNGASEQHAIGRLGSGFDLPEVVSEYRALRASVLRLWDDSRPDPDDSAVDDVTRFNESIDQSLAKAVSSYTKRVNQSRDLFLAILSHDLRNPLNSIAMSAALLPRLVKPAADTNEVVAQIATNADVMARMISDLLDYTRTRLGAGMPVHVAPMDLGILSEELFKEFRTAHPSRNIRFQSEGELSGHWDADRLRQAISNVMGNAIQHSPQSALVELRVMGEGPIVRLVVYNGGSVIPPGELASIFDPLVRGSSAEHPRQHRPGSIGLGLYIARQIAQSHGGSVDATSSEEAGTEFTVRLPREFIKDFGQPILDENQLRTM
ncbi:MAG: HAMP domain-containing histidine kinase [Planctomycetales bacterium]|nr:HAMP domain-containing histidine kinase [Planctomycetales bacterium]